MAIRAANAPAWSALIVLLLCGRTAGAGNEPCPSPTDLPYRVKDDDTLSQITERAYCLDGAPRINQAWRELADYNRIPIGDNPHLIFTKTEICLPARLGAGSSQAVRCVSGDADFGGPGRPATCGNNKREGSEACDGSDLGAMTCETLGLRPGRLACRADCASLDASGCLPPPCAEDARASQPAGATCAGSGDGSDDGRSILRRVAVELVAGVTVPLTAATRDRVYSAIFTAALGVRLTLGPIEIAPRAMLVAGAHGILFNDIEQDQTLIGGGGALQIGVPFTTASLRFTPGLEAGLLYVSRSIDRIDYPFQGQVETQAGSIPFLGVFVRTEYMFKPDRDAPGFGLALEVSGDLIPVSLAGNNVSENINAKVLGGIGYAF